jgi:hypothetical protein
MLSPATRRSYGPFNINNSAGPLPGEFLTLVWSKVRGSNVLVAVTDDADTGVTAGFQVPFAIPTVEITLFGNIQGFLTQLKTTVIRMKTGPMCYVFPDEEGWENIIFCARPFIGGKPQGARITPGTPLAAGLGINMQASVYIMPRGGFSEQFNE